MAKKKTAKKTDYPEFKEKKVSLGNAIIIGAVLAVFGVFIGINFNNIAGGFGFYLGGSKNADLNQSELDEIYDKLIESYNGEIDGVKLLEGAKKGMVEAVGDVYTEYMDTEEAENYTNSVLHGNVGAGVGVEMGLRDGYVRVLRLLPNNPAERAGVMIGDIIYKIDGQEVYTWTTTEIAKILRGEAGTEVVLTVARDGKEVEFKMVREEINNVSEYVTYDGDTAIITVTRFDSNTGTQIQKEAAKFKEKGVNKVILDLRGNGGGYVAAAQDLLSLWLDGKLILTQKSEHFGEDKINTSSGRAILKDMKTVVLVNGSTASASEITAAALKDYGKATIVGTKTYGKGVVQKMFNLSGGGMLKITVAEWLSPKGNSINNNGVTPDVEVTMTVEDINKMRDPQLGKAKSL